MIAAGRHTRLLTSPAPYGNGLTALTTFCVCRTTSGGANPRARRLLPVGMQYALPSAARRVTLAFC